MTAPTAAPPRGNGHRRLPGRERSTSAQAAVRNRGRIAAGIAMLTVGAILAVLVYGNLGDRSPVLAAARDIRPGQVIEDSDLRVVRIASDPGVATVAASRRADVVGRRAAVGVVAGALLAPAGVTDGSTLPKGHTVVGAIVKPGQDPLGRREGDDVIVSLPTGGESGRGVDGRIVAVSAQAGPEGTAISLAVPDERAAPVAAAGAQGQLILRDPVR